MIFSRRVPSDLSPNRLAQAVEDLGRSGRPIVDLTESNPTRVGFDYPADLLAPLADCRALTYAPEPFGLREARTAVSADYARRGLAVPADRIMLTASTSEAYSLLFKILCDPDDEILIPRPGYPLFEHLARLEATVSQSYDLEYHARWSIDLAGLERKLTARTRAVVLVTPNNPTGSLAAPEELDAIAAMCAARGVAIIADEVFADYEITPGAAQRGAQVLARQDALIFGLGGLSKSAGLPQVKLGWIAVAGPDAEVRDALARLELAADTYLSVSTPVQVAAGKLLERGAAVRRQIQSRVVANYRELMGQAAAVPSCHALHADGGWYAVLRVPSLCSEEDLVLELLTENGVLVHPGYFFDFPEVPGESSLIASLLAPESAFRSGVAAIFRHAGRKGDRR